MNTNLFKQFGSALDAQNEQPIGQPTSRRAAFGTLGKLGLAGAAYAVSPLISAAGKLHAQSTGDSPAAILNYALTLENLEYYYYQNALDSGVISGSYRDLFETIRNHELAHVNLLEGAVSENGGDPVSFDSDSFDFTAGGAFAPFNDEETFLLLSQGFEDTGVRAYKGRAAEVGAASGALLTVALQIHSVEARHAAAVRIIRGALPYVPGNQSGAPAAVAPIYAGEDNVTQGGVNLDDALEAYSTQNITEAFDEILTPEQVLAIAGQFFAEED